MSRATADGYSPARAILVSSVAALGGFLFGYDTSVINGAVDAIQSEFGLGSLFTGFGVASALIGCAVGAWFAGALSDRYGRVRVMLVAAAFFAVSAIGSGFSVGVADLIVWRLIGGFGVGTASVIAPAYIAEVAPARLRGRLGSLQQLAIVLGIFAALVVNAFLADTAGGAQESLWFDIAAWRWMFMAELVPALAYGLLALRIPESPRYLVAKRRFDEAADVLTEVIGIQDTDGKIADIRRSLEREDRPSMRDLKGKRLGLKPIVWVGIALSVFQQAVGINVIFYYSTTLWQSVGYEEGDAFFTSVLNSGVNVAATLVAIAIVDKVGRKLLLLVGSAGMAVSLGAMALAFSQAVGTGDEVSLPDPWGTVALFAANGFVIFFAASWGPVVWVLLGEMFPNRIRAAALAVAAAAQWAANFLVSMTFPVLSQEIGLTFAYGMYATFAALSFLFVWWKISETKGIELEDMSEDVPSRPRRGRGAASPGG
ncbi:sugar porter family MFS transporter [Egicoccus halophilus]|uniref:MFS transporter n=1 Tax=Egicoccus halophilus TaxID=1670830 RepID=A0A8J3A956_9ACTN|nr:sugar porter family MFS transporter [Egicoccus halophilus]GGI04817.1 MFS transporter [Egicoccus halophilus]